MAELLCAFKASLPPSQTRLSEKIDKINAIKESGDIVVLIAYVRIEFCWLRYTVFLGLILHSSASWNEDTATS
jgi:hypothetical protein